MKTSVSILRTQTLDKYLILYKLNMINLTLRVYKHLVSNFKHSCKSQFRIHIPMEAML